MGFSSYWTFAGSVNSEDSIVFDPFTGSGSTGIASVLLNREFIGCELTPEYIPLAKARIEYAINDGELFE